MSNESNPNESGKTVDSFKSDQVNGETIVGGAGKIIMPTLEEEAAGINNSGFPVDEKGNPAGYVDDGTSSPVVNADGTI